MVKLGEKRMLVPTMEGGALMKPMQATVVWMHPKNRFFVAEFAFTGGWTLREAYPMPRSWGENAPGYGVANMTRGGYRRHEGH